MRQFQCHSTSDPLISHQTCKSLIFFSFAHQNYATVRWLTQAEGSIALEELAKALLALLEAYDELPSTPTLRRHQESN